MTQNQILITFFLSVSLLGCCLDILHYSPLTVDLFLCNLTTAFWWCGGQLLIWMPSIHVPFFVLFFVFFLFFVFPSENHCIFLWENSPTLLHGGIDWAFIRVLPLQAVATRSQLGSSNHLPTIGIMSRWTQGSKMLELTLAATQESFYEFLLHGFPLSCFRPVPSKTCSLSHVWSSTSSYGILFLGNKPFMGRWEMRDNYILSLPASPII